jgi:hypothetical protein
MMKKPNKNLHTGDLVEHRVVLFCKDSYSGYDISSECLRPTILPNVSRRILNCYVMGNNNKIVP